MITRSSSSSIMLCSFLFSIFILDFANGQYQYQPPVNQNSNQNQNPYQNQFGSSSSNVNNNNNNRNINSNSNFGNQNQNNQNVNSIGNAGWGSNQYQSNQFNNPLANATTTPSTINRGVTIQFQLRGYSNPQSALPNNNYCICPPGQTCSYFETNPKCYFAFTFIISSPDESVRYSMSDFFYLDANGQLPQASQGQWGQNYVMQVPSKPSAIDVFAYHLGSAITSNGIPAHVKTFTHVDTFVVPLLDTIPAVDGVQSMNQQRTYQGKLLGTSLSMSFSVSCSGNLIGPSCDMTCKSSHINSNVAACVSNSTGFFSVCNYVNGGQVDNCKNCPWGIKEGTYCQDEHGSLLDPREAGLVGSGWQTASIILAILTFLFLLLLCATIIFACARSRKPVEKEMVTFNKRQSDDREPLNNQSASYRQDASSLPPKQAMMPPPHDSKPIKSAMRRPNYTPLSDDSASFVSDMPVRPSRSEVV